MFLDQADIALHAKPCVCYAQVMLNGAFVYRGNAGEPLFDLSSMSPASIESIEYYASSAVMPMEFSTPFQVDCGLIVIWTRRSL